MPGSTGEAGTPADWMTHARSNLARARAPKPAEALWEDVCFDAEQAAEKAIKALLLHKGIEFPKTHSSCGGCFSSVPPRRIAGGATI
jgi:uncharacterized protein (UPF0332 family)